MHDGNDERANDELHDGGRSFVPLARAGGFGAKRRSAAEVYSEAKMKRLTLVLGGAAVAGLAAVIAVAQQSGDTQEESLIFPGELMSPKEISAGRKLYAANCASCHGVRLEGQADWKRRLDSGKMPAPPHDETGHTWHHSDQDLFTITKSGVSAVVAGYDSDMPAFDGVLSDAEIRTVLAYIKSTWPDRQREYQEKITKNERAKP